MSDPPTDPFGPEGLSGIDDLTEIPEADLWDILYEEAPGLGRVRRLFRAAKQILSREYIQKIKKLQQKEDTLIRILGDQNRAIALLRVELQAAENKTQELTQRNTVLEQRNRALQLAVAKYTKPQEPTQAADGASRPMPASPEPPKPETPPRPQAD